MIQRYANISGRKFQLMKSDNGQALFGHLCQVVISENSGVWSVV